jgi:uncharacterized damage-inducible protein DinB
MFERVFEGQEPITNNQQPLNYQPTTMMKDQLIEAWRISNRMNLLLIDNVDDKGMQKALSSCGGRTVYQQLVHVHNVRLGRVENAAKDIFKKYSLIDKEGIYDTNALRKSFEESGKAVEELIKKSWDDDGKLKGFKKGLIPFVAYLIAHEGHHRGHAILTLKQSGVKIPEVLRWGLWEWEK